MADRFHIVQTARRLESHIDDSNQALGRFLEPVEHLHIRSPKVFAVLRAFFAGGEEGLLHLDAPEDRASRRLLLMKPDGGLVGLRQHILWQGHGGRGEGSDAVAGIESRHSFEPFVVSAGKIVARVAVGVDVD